ncbi:MAG: arginine--tRNA ligase [Armatimonadota bacterium]
MIKPVLVSAFTHAALAAKQAGRLQFEVLPAFTIERPANLAFGDLSVNLAMLLAGEAKGTPRQAAQALIDYLQLPADLVERVEITGPGFIHLYLKPAWLHEAVLEIHRRGDAYGRSDLGQGTPVLVEFVSANPNGPLGIQHGRGAIIGDVLCSVLAVAGFAVSREFYVNDTATSTQMVRFGESLVVRYLQALGQPIEFPEDGYAGDYVIDFAQKILARDGDTHLRAPAAERLELFTELGREAMIAWHREVLVRLGVEFDTWFRESALFAQGKVEGTLQQLAERGETFEAEGAVWLATTRYGDDKDRPLVRSNGKPTYLASDVAYHQDKFDRGYQILIDIWGADHHGYIARTKAAMAALGHDPDKVHVLISQAVRLTRDGELLVGKRKGDIALLSELIDQVGPDAARLFFLLSSADSELDFDLELATRESPENPLYDIQSARRRIADIQRAAREQGISPDPSDTDLTSLAHEAEVALIRVLVDLPEEIRTAADLYQPHRLARYAQEIARAIHLFADQCPALGDLPTPTRTARLVLIGAAAITLRNTLTLLGLATADAISPT